jgi:hypothetical protein
MIFLTVCRFPSQIEIPLKMSDRAFSKLEYSMFSG